MAEGPFSRVYYVDLEENFRQVWDDDVALAVYVRLLSVAEAMWPAIPEVPRSARNAVVKQLIEAGLVIPVPPYRFRILGLDAARSARRSAASYAANIRHGNAPEMPSRTEPIRTVPTAIAQSAPPHRNPVLIDPQTQTDEERKAAYIAGMEKQLGLKP